MLNYLEMKQEMRNCVFIILLLIRPTSAAFGQEFTMVQGPAQKAGKYQVSLRLPEEGLVSGDEQQIEFRVVNLSREDPVLGPAAVVRAVAQAVITMPAMPSMPKIEVLAHSEGVPGDYGLHPTFAHGGDYLLLLKIAPPADEPFAIEFPLKVADELPNRKPRPKPFKLELATAPGKIKAAEPAKLQLKVRANRETLDPAGIPTGKRRLEQVMTFDLIHEKLMHLIIVRKDLSFFSHQHPEIQADGSFALSSFIFPRAGVYQLFADIAPKGAGGQVLLATLKVEGRPDQPGTESALRNTSNRAIDQIVEGVRVTFIGSAGSGAIISKKTVPLAVAMHQAGSGEAVNDLQPYLGALAHLIIIHEDAQTFVHAHPDDREPDNGLQGHLTFLARLPKPGLYRAWVEFQRGGKVNTAVFIIEAKEASRKDHVQQDEK